MKIKGTCTMCGTDWMIMGVEPVRKLTDKNVPDIFVGKKIQRSAYEQIRWSKHGVLRICVNTDDEQFIKIFGITGVLIDDWMYRGISLNLTVTIENEVITKCIVDKIREGDCGHFRPVTRVLKPTQQELRIIRRILQYITEADGE